MQLLLAIVPWFCSMSNYHFLIKILKFESRSSSVCKILPVAFEDWCRARAGVWASTNLYTSFVHSFLRNSAADFQDLSLESIKWVLNQLPNQSNLFLAAEKFGSVCLFLLLEFCVPKIDQCFSWRNDFDRLWS